MRIYLLLLFVISGSSLFAQNEGMFRIPTVELTPSERIVQERQMLRQAFLSGDDQGVNRLLDTLTLVLEDSVLAATFPEERWLLWYWTGNYPRLFADVLDYNQHYRFVQSQKLPPPADSLIQLLDEVSAASAHLLYQKITAAHLGAEETAFATLHLQYLLTPRPTDRQVEEQDENVVAFLEKFPASPFRYYLRNFLYGHTKMLNKGVDLDIMLTVARPDGRYGAHFRTAVGFSFGIDYWKNRWLVGGRFGMGFQSTRIDFLLERTDVARDSLGILGYLGAETGLIVLNKGKVRVTPMAGGGLALLSIPARREFDFAQRYSYLNFYGQVGLNLDYRIGRRKDAYEWSSGATGQGGIRVSLGYQWMSFGNKDLALQGNMLFIGVGYTFMTRHAYPLSYQ